MNPEQMKKHMIHCFRRATYCTSILNMIGEGAFECNQKAFLSRPKVLFYYLKGIVTCIT